MKNTLLVSLLTGIAVVAGADDALDNDYYVSIAISEYGMFETGKEYTYSDGWHADSMIDANQQAQAACEWEASEVGTRCISSSSTLGGCISLAEGNLVLQPNDTGTTPYWTRLFVASSPLGQSEAEEAATKSCESMTSGYNEDQIKSFVCKTVQSFCASDGEESSQPTFEPTLEPLCDDKGTPEGAECWVKLLAAEVDCYVWSTVNNSHLFAVADRHRIRSCPGKILNGDYAISFTFVDADDEMRTEIYDGPWMNGRMSAGRWSERNTPYDNSQFSGYRDDHGLRIGQWVGYPDNGGASWEIQYRDGRPHKVIGRDGVTE